MKNRKRTDITVETHKTTVIRVNRHQTCTAYCGLCGGKVMYFSVSRTAAILGFSETAIFRLAESGEIHSLENAAGSLLICGNSLLAVNDEISQRATTINRTKLETNKEH